MNKLLLLLLLLNIHSINWLVWVTQRSISLFQIPASSDVRTLAQVDDVIVLPLLVYPYFEISIEQHGIRKVLLNKRDPEWSKWFCSILLSHRGRLLDRGPLLERGVLLNKRHLFGSGFLLGLLRYVGKLRSFSKDKQHGIRKVLLNKRDPEWTKWFCSILLSHRGRLLDRGPLLERGVLLNKRHLFGSGRLLGLLRYVGKLRSYSKDK